jgi:hypothetical protein
MAPIITTLHLTHLPSELAIHVALCRNLENAAFLRQQLLDGNPEFEYAFLDASTVGHSSCPSYTALMGPEQSLDSHMSNLLEWVIDCSG